MEKTNLKNELHNKIESLSDNEVEAVYMLLLDYLGYDEADEISEEHKTIIDNRLLDHENNPQNVISWDASQKLVSKYL
jgi:hypothetical protein